MPPGHAFKGRLCRWTYAQHCPIVRRALWCPRLRTRHAGGADRIGRTLLIFLGSREGRTEMRTPIVLVALVYLLAGCNSIVDTSTSETTGTSSEGQQGGTAGTSNTGGHAGTASIGGNAGAGTTGGVAGTGGGSGASGAPVCTNDCAALSNGDCVSCSSPDDCAVGGDYDWACTDGWCEKPCQWNSDCSDFNICTTNWCDPDTHRCRSQRCC